MNRILTNSIYTSAEKFPDKIAFKQDDRQLSYQELVYNSNNVANFLINSGVKKGDRVGIFMNRALESAQVIYGIFAAGAAYVPIDSNQPVNRIVEILKDCDINILFTKDLYADKVAKVCQAYNGLKVLVGIHKKLEVNSNVVGWDEISGFENLRPDVNPKEEDIAYIMYTSGTTGRPKGIVHTQRSGYSYAKLSSELYGVTENDILGSHSQLHYDISTMAYFSMPLVGGASIIISEAYTLFPNSLGSLIEKEGMTLWYSVPLALIQMLKANSLEGRDLSKLKWVLFGGEVFALSYIKELFKYAPTAKLSNVYGPAEVNQCTYYNFDKDTPLNDPIPLGLVWDETDIVIDYGKGDKDESIGELLVSSSTQMKEYWNQPALTESKMVHYNVEEGASKRFYRTGDIVKKEEGGQLIFLGRKDRQVKVRGYRVELNEIERIILSLPSIQEAAVYVRKQEDALQIYADIVFGKNTITREEVMNHLAEYLPRHSLPSEIKITQEIPRTGAGKIDYKFLSK